MKKQLCVMAAACGLLSLASCSDDENVIINDQPVAATGEQVIVLDMQDTDDLATKSRPLYSTTNKGAELVTNVQLLVFKKGTSDNEYKFVKKLSQIDNWNNTSTDYTFGRKWSWKLTGTDRLDGSDGDTFIILAVGQDESDENSIPAPFKLETGTTDYLISELGSYDWTDATWNLASTPGNGFLTTASVEMDDRIGEIFSGVSSPIEFTIDGGFSTTVLLKRQVAGVLGYFSRIPASIGEGGDAKRVDAIRLVSSNKNLSVDLTTQLAKQVDDATYDEPGYQGTENIINGFVEATSSNDYDARFGIGEQTTGQEDAYTVYTIDLADWFDKKDDGSGDWADESLITTDDNTKLLGNVEGWNNALDASNSSVVVADGAVLAGEFIIPFAKTTDNTFELQLLNIDGGTTTVLKTWDVNLDQMSQTEQDGQKVYNIYRNHLYQIGKRNAGDDPDQPGTDPDDPQELDKDQELVIRINDNWEFLHEMEIE